MEVGELEEVEEVGEVEEVEEVGEVGEVEGMTKHRKVGSNVLRIDPNNNYIVHFHREIGQ